MPLTKQELIDRAKAASASGGGGEDWGEVVELEEDDFFVGRYRGETTDPGNSDPAGNPRRVYLLWDEDNHQRYIRGRTKLEQEMERAKPSVGDVIAIYRGENVTTGTGNTMHAYGITIEPSEQPLPEAVAAASRDRDIPF